LTRVIVAIAPHIQLPALVGGQMSLNLFLALVGRSGAGKDAALAIGDAAIGVGPVEIRTPGSGEGIAHCFVTRTKTGIEQHTTAVLFIAAEVDALTQLVAGQGSYPRHIHRWHFFSSDPVNTGVRNLTLTVFPAATGGVAPPCPPLRLHP
jgi:hypothetical protein